ncbi:transposase [Endozoicomonas sp. ISHI1]|uniref:transposase n=1 Tax=Endozoicomonas sp. ISHI1 TaxID=2825882 RepID=UPI00359F4DA6
MLSQVIDFCLSQAKEGKAQQTFGHDLKCNVHVHRSITCGGLTTPSGVYSDYAT